MFESAKEGDKVYSLLWGEGVVSCFFKNTSSNYPLKVSFGSFEDHTFSIEGRSIITDAEPTLFWSKPEIIAPKRKIKKTVEFWINIYDDASGLRPYGHTHATEEIATSGRDFDNNKTDYVETVKFTHTYEVEG